MTNWVRPKLQKQSKITLWMPSSLELDNNQLMSGRLKSPTRKLEIRGSKFLYKNLVSAAARGCSEDIFLWMGG